MDWFEHTWDHKKRTPDRPAAVVIWVNERPPHLIYIYLSRNIVEFVEARASEFVKLAVAYRYFFSLPKSLNLITEGIVRKNFVYNWRPMEQGS